MTGRQVITGSYRVLKRLYSCCCFCSVKTAAVKSTCVSAMGISSEAKIGLGLQFHTAAGTGNQLQPSPRGLLLPNRLRPYSVSQLSWRTFRTSSIISSDDIDDSDFIKSDPAVRRLLQEMSADFGHTKQNDLVNNDISSSSDRDTCESIEDQSQGPLFDSDGGQNTTTSSDSLNILEMTDDLDLETEDFEEFGDEIQYEWVEEEKEAPIPLKRGQTGVIDIDELVTVLRIENAGDICVIEVPKESRYVDYLTIVSARSVRHMKALAEYIKLLYKQKKGLKDKFTKIEGVDSQNWMAIDLGNIALHIFMPDAREFYDLETLWTCGEEFDDKSREEIDPYLPFPDADFSIGQNDLYTDSMTTQHESLTSVEPESFESHVYHAPSQKDSLKPPQT